MGNSTVSNLPASGALNGTELFYADNGSDVKVTAVQIATYASSYKVVTFTRDASLPSGNQSITGVGFTPRFIQFAAGLATQNGGQWSSQGQSDGLSNTCTETSLAPSFLVTFIRNGFAGVVRENITAVDTNTFSLVSFDADGFTIAWSRSGSPTSLLTVIATCIR